MISAISSSGKAHFLLYSEAIDADRLIGFMAGLIRDAGCRVFLILDNLRVHHSKKVREWVKERPNRIALFHLPAYAPEHNPDEYLNHDLKRTLGTPESFMNALATDPEHVQAYFNHPVLHPYKLNRFDCLIAGVII